MDASSISENDGKYFIWDDKVVCILRETWQIVGALVGCLPNHPMQNLLSGLPAQLKKEEVLFLLTKEALNWKINIQEICNFQTSTVPQDDYIQLKSYFCICGFFLTHGGKFGGDYLAYPGDPSRFHSFYIVILLEKKEGTFCNGNDSFRSTRFSRKEVYFAVFLR